MVFTQMVKCTTIADKPVEVLKWNNNNKKTQLFQMKAGEENVKDQSKYKV